MDIEERAEYEAELRASEGCYRGECELYTKEPLKSVIVEGCESPGCKGDLIEFGKQLDKNKPDQFRCKVCGKLHIIRGI